MMGRVILGLLMALGSGLVVNRPAVAQSAPEVIWRDIMFAPRGGEAIPAQLGRFEVPARRLDDSGVTIPIQFIRFPSRSPNPGPPIVYLAGGPGGSGIAAAAGSRWPLFDSLREVADVIAFDQRGTGRALNLPTCTTGVPVPRSVPTTRDNLSQAYARQVSHCRTFWDSTGVDLRAFNTLESADDLEDLRKALGAEQLDLWGISYGTHLALATMRRYPERIGRAVLVSAEGLDQTAKSPASGDAFWRRVQESINRDASARTRYPDVAGTIQRVIERVTARPQVVSLSIDGADTEIVLGDFEIQRLAADRLAEPEGTATVLEAFRRAEEGDFSVFGRWAQRVTGQPIYIDPMPLAMDAASGISELRKARILAEAESALLADALAWPVLHVASQLDFLDLGEGFRARFQSDHPVLFISGTLDGRTFPDEHLEIASQFESSTIITVVNGGHNSVLNPESVRASIVDFFARRPVADQSVELPSPPWIVEGDSSERAPSEPPSPVASADTAGVIRASLDYLEGFYEGDEAKIRRGVHPNAVKYGFFLSDGVAEYSGEPMSFQEMLEYARGVSEGGTQPPPTAPKEVRVFEVLDQTAAARVTAWWGSDFLHLARYDGEWRITHVLWQTPPPAR